ncbi:proteophosphoglycan related protein [Cystoisospora suis]|uniref:Proteophosphoglycan related protein n=1 Tax=Cystoisospora suis TaxID=483139 RepID=A0A2C6LF91_9APIC|nr:proteophosphoglycan related protein [Cystoisospora suis]
MSSLFERVCKIVPVAETMDEKNERRTSQIKGGGENCLFPLSSSSCRLMNIGRETSVSSDERVKAGGTKKEETPCEVLSPEPLDALNYRRSSSCSPHGEISSLSGSAFSTEDISFEGGSLEKKDACQHEDTRTDSRLLIHDASVRASPSPWTSSSLVGGGGEDLKSSLSSSMSPHAFSSYLASLERSPSRKALQESIHRRCDEVENFLRQIRSAAPSSLCSSPPCPLEGALSEADVDSVPVEAVRADQVPLVSSRLPLLCRAKSKKESEKEIEGESSLCQPRRNSGVSTDHEEGSNISQDRCDGHFDSAMKYESPSPSAPCFHASSECVSPSRRRVSSCEKEERQRRPLSNRKGVSQGSNSYGGVCSTTSEMHGNRHPLSSSPSLRTLDNKVQIGSRRMRREESHMNPRLVAKTRFGSSTNSRRRCGGETSRSIPVVSSSPSTNRYCPTSEASSSPSSVLVGTSPHTVFSPNNEGSSTSLLSNGLPSLSRSGTYNDTLASTSSPSSFPRLQSSDHAPKSGVRAHAGDDNVMDCQVLRGRSPPPPSRPLPLQTSGIKTRSHYSSKKNLKRTTSKGCPGGEGRSETVRKRNTSVPPAKGSGEGLRRVLTGSSASPRPLSVQRSLLHSSSSSSTLRGENLLHLVSVTNQEREEDVSSLRVVSHHVGDGGRRLTLSRKGRRSLSVSAGEKSSSSFVHPTTAVARSVSTSCDDHPRHSGVVSRPVSFSSASSSSLLLRSSSSSLTNHDEGSFSSPRDLRPKSFLSPRVMPRPRTARKHQPAIPTTHNRAYQQRKCSPQASRHLGRSPSSSSMQSSTRKQSPRAMTTKRPETMMWKPLQTGSRFIDSKFSGIGGRRHKESAEVPSSPERSQQSHHEKQRRHPKTSLQKSTSRSLLSSAACSSSSTTSSFQRPPGKNPLSSSLSSISFSSASFLQREVSLSASSSSTSKRKGETPSKVLRGRRRPGEPKAVSSVSSLSSSASRSNLQSHSNHEPKNTQLAGGGHSKHHPLLHLRDNLPPSSTFDQSSTTATASLSAITPSKRTAFSSFSSATAPRREGGNTAVMTSSSLSTVRGGVHSANANIVSSSSSCQQDTSPPHLEVTQPKVQEENRDLRCFRQDSEKDRKETTTFLSGIRTYRSEDGRAVDSDDRIRSSSVSNRCYRHRTYSSSSSSSVPPQSPSRSCSPSFTRFLNSSEKLDRMQKMKEKLSETSSSPAFSFVSRIRRDLLMNAFHQESSSLSKSPSDILTMFKIMSRVVHSNQDTPPSFTSPSSSSCDSSSSCSLKSLDASVAPSTPPSEAFLKTSLFSSSSSSCFARNLEAVLDRPSPQSSFSSRTFLGDECPSSLWSSSDDNHIPHSSSSAGTNPSPLSGELNGSLIASDSSSSPCSSSCFALCSSRREMPSHFSPSSSSEIVARLEKDASYLSLSRSSRFPSSKDSLSFFTKTRREDSSPDSSSVSPSVSSSCCSSPSLTCSVLDPSKYREKSLYFSTVPICASSPPSSSKDFGTSSNSFSGSDNEESSCKVQPSDAEAGDDASGKGRREEGSSLHSAAGEKKEEDVEKVNTTENSGEGERREGSISKPPNEAKERKTGEGVTASEGDSSSGVTHVKDSEKAPLLPSSTVDEEGHGKGGDENVPSSESLSRAGSSSFFSFLKSGVMLPRLRLGSLLEATDQGTPVPHLDESLHSISSSSSSVSSSSLSSSSLGGGEIRKNLHEEEALENRTVTGTDERVSQGETAKLSSPQAVFQEESSHSSSFESDKNAASLSTEDGRTSVFASSSTESGGNEVVKSRGEESIPSPGDIERGDDKDRGLSSGSLLHVPTEETTRGGDDQIDPGISESLSSCLPVSSVDAGKEVPKGLEASSRSPPSPSSSPRRLSPRNPSGISHVSSAVRTKVSMAKKTSASPPASRRPSSSTAAVSSSDVKSSAGVAGKGGGGGGKEVKKIEESVEEGSPTTTVAPSSSVAGKTHYVGKKSPTLHPTPKPATRTTGTTQADGVSRKGLEKALLFKKEVAGDRKKIGNGIGGESTEKKEGIDIPRVTISRSPSLEQKGVLSISAKAKSSLRRGSASSVASSSASQRSTQSVRGPGGLSGKGRTRTSSVASTPSSPSSSSGGGATSPQTLQSPSFSVEVREVEEQGGGGGAGAGKAKGVTKRPLTGMVKKTATLTGGEVHKKAPFSPRGKSAGTAGATLSNSIQVSSGGSEGGVSTSSNASGSPRTPAPTPSTTTSSVKPPSALRAAKKASKPPSVGQQQQQQPLSSSSSSGRLSRTRTRSFSPSPSFSPSSSSPPASPALSSSTGRMTSAGGGLTVKTVGGAAAKRRVTLAIPSPSCPATASPPASPPSTVAHASSAASLGGPGSSKVTGGGILRRKTAFATPEVSSVSASPQSKPRLATSVGTPKSLPSLDDVPAERRKTTTSVPASRSLLPASSQIRGSGEEGPSPTTTATVSSSVSSSAHPNRLTALSQQRRKTTAGLLSLRGTAAASTTLAHASSDVTVAKAGGGLLARGRGKSVVVTGSTPSTSASSTATTTMTKARRPTRVLATPGVGPGVKAVKKEDGKEEEEEAVSPEEAGGKGTTRTRTSVEIVRDIKCMIRNRLEQERKDEKDAEEASSSKHYDVSDLPLPVRRGQPRVQIPAGPFPPIRDAPELEESSGLHLLQAALGRGGGVSAGGSPSCSTLPRQVGSFSGGGDRDNQVNVCGSFFSFESALYSLYMEMLLLIPLDMKNMRRWIHQSLGEVERERKELIDVYDYLRVLPGFYMDKRKNMNPLNFLKKFLNERKWKERWGKGWLGRDGRLLPVFPRERLLHAFFFAEGIEGGPDYECKMMEKEDKLMRRFIRLEALVKQREELKSRLLKEEKKLLGQVLFKKKRLLQLKYMVDCLIDAVKDYQKPKTYYSYYPSQSPFSSSCLPACRLSPLKGTSGHSSSSSSSSYYYTAESGAPNAVVFGRGQGGGGTDLFSSSAEKSLFSFSKVSPLFDFQPKVEKVIPVEDDVFGENPPESKKTFLSNVDSKETSGEWVSWGGRPRGETNNQMIRLWPSCGVSTARLESTGGAGESWEFLSSTTEEDAESLVYGRGRTTTLSMKSGDQRRDSVVSSISRATSKHSEKTGDSTSQGETVTFHYCPRRREYAISFATTTTEDTNDSTSYAPLSARALDSISQVYPPFAPTRLLRHMLGDLPRRFSGASASSRRSSVYHASGDRRISTFSNDGWIKANTKKESAGGAPALSRFDLTNDEHLNSSSFFCDMTSYFSSHEVISLKRELMPRLLPSVECIRHLFRTKQFAELNRLFVSLDGRSIPEIWLAMDREEARLRMLSLPCRYAFYDCGQLLQGLPTSVLHPVEASLRNTTTTAPSSLPEGEHSPEFSRPKSREGSPRKEEDGHRDEASNISLGEDEAISIEEKSIDGEETKSSGVKSSKTVGEGRKVASKRKQSKEIKPKAKSHLGRSSEAGNTIPARSRSPSAYRVKKPGRTASVSPTGGSKTSSPNAELSSSDDKVDTAHPNETDVPAGQHDEGEQGQEEEGSASSFLCPPSASVSSSSINKQRRKTSPNLLKKPPVSARRTSTATAGSEDGDGIGAGLSAVKTRSNSSNKIVRAVKSTGPAAIKSTRASLVQHGATTAVKETGKALGSRGSSLTSMPLVRKTSVPEEAPKQKKRRQTELAVLSTSRQKSPTEKHDKNGQRGVSYSSPTTPSAGIPSSSRRATAIA